MPVGRGAVEQILALLANQTMLSGPRLKDSHPEMQTVMMRESMIAGT
jgi:hypothetical protein